MAFVSWETMLNSSYRISIAGLKISTFRLAILALFSRLISSSVFPENMDPQTTSIQPLRSPIIVGSINIVKLIGLIIHSVLIGKQFVTLNH